MAIYKYNGDLGLAYTKHDPAVDQIIVDEDGNVTVKTDADRDDTQNNLEVL